MKKIDLYISNTAPNVRGAAAWLKPTKGGYELVIIDGGEKPLVTEDNSNNVAFDADVIKNEVIGSVKDKKSANTINGAKAYAKDIKDAIVGKSSDTLADLTLKGLKAYIDKKLAELE